MDIEKQKQIVENLRELLDITVKESLNHQDLCYEDEILKLSQALQINHSILIEEIQKHRIENC